jgi:hypothetical protein
VSPAISEPKKRAQRRGGAENFNDEKHGYLNR